MSGHRRINVSTSRRPMRVLHFITGFGLGGSEWQTVRLVQGLSRSGFEVHLACFRKEGELLREVDGYPCTRFRVGSFRHPQALAQQLRFARFVRRHEFDVVHATGLHPNVFAVPAARLAGVPAVLASIRDLGDPWSPLERRVQRFACRFAHRVLANSGAVRDRLEQEGHDPSRITVIPNAVARRDAVPGADPLHDEFGVPAGVPVIGAVARMVRVKGIEYFIEAAARLAPRFPEARFVLVGGPIPGSEIRDGSTYENELHDLVAAHGLGDRVIFTGDRNDVPEMLARFTVAVLPSLSEGFPNALLESLGAGIPTVATRVGGSPEIVEDGVSGLLVPPRDAAHLAEAVARLLHDPDLAARLSGAGQARVSTRFTEAMLVERTASSYLRLLRDGTEAPAARRLLTIEDSRPDVDRLDPAWRKH